MKYKTTKQFLFGTASAAYQCEGAIDQDGRGPCIWDEVLLKTNRALNKYDPSYASNHYYQYKEDIDLAAKFNVKSMRMSISWSRLFPKDNKKINLKAVQHYHDVFSYMLSKDIIPNVTLHHFDSPMWLVKKGDFIKRDNVKYFKAYAEYCFKEFKEVYLWSTINEIHAYSNDKYIKSSIIPFGKNDFLNYFIHVYHMLLAHAEAVLSFKRLKCKGKIGIANANAFYYPINKNERIIKATSLANTVQNAFIFEAEFLGKFSSIILNDLKTILKDEFKKLIITELDLKILKEAAINMDWVGVNYYMSWWIDLPDDKTVTSYNTTGDKGKTAINFGNMYKIMVKPNVSTTLWDWPIYPKGLEDLIKSIYHKYHFKKDLYITENGIGNKEILSKTKTIDDDYRIDYVKKHLLILKKLIKQNYPIAGYYLWSHTDCLSWTNGYDKRYGMFYVDWKTQKRYLKKFAYWWKIFVDKNINKWF